MVNMSADNIDFRRDYRMKAYVLLCNGFEEVEALTTVDILKRAGVEVAMIAPYGEEYVEGSHGITVKADVYVFNDAELGDADAVILPGGKAGTANLKAHPGVANMIKAYYESGKLVCAICAAPTVLGAAGILDGRKCTCFPGWEEGLGKGIHVGGPAVKDGNVITGKSMGCSVDFALAVAEALVGKEAAEKVETSIYRS